jgi:hypothetical protein
VRATAQRQAVPMLRSLPIALLHVGVLVAPAALAILQHT